MALSIQRLLNVALAGAALAGIDPAWAASVTIPHVFSSGAPARAADVNENFTVLANAIDAQNAGNTALSTAVQALQKAQAAGFTFRGTWSDRSAYSVNDVVARNGSSYVAIAEVSSIDPVSTAASHFWALIAARGSDGASGAVGATGLAGATGPAGPTGPMGSTGPMGPAGTPGASGPAGAQGVAGPMGPAGTAGQNGAAGPQGSQGPSGPTGPRGSDGSDGANGANGEGLVFSDDKTSIGAGEKALASDKEGARNIAIGTESLLNNVAGNDNTAIGHQSLSLLSDRSGNSNIAIGSGAGAQLKQGDRNIYIGHGGVDSEDGIVRIGNDREQGKAFIAGIYGVVPDGRGSAAVVVDEFGQLGILSSSRRYKYDIKPIGAASDALLQLRPVSFLYTKAGQGGSHPPQFGLIAEEVAEVLPQLVVNDQQGRPETVAYHLLPVLLLDELQKQNAVIVDLENRLRQLEHGAKHP